MTIPKSPVDLFKKTIMVFAGLSMVSQGRGDIGQISSILKKLPLQDTLGLLSGMTMLFVNERDHEKLEFALREIYLKENHKGIITNFEKQNNVSTRVFTRLGLVQLINLARLNCKKWSPQELETCDHAWVNQKLGFCFLMINDLITDVEPSFEGLTHKEIVPLYASLSTRQILFNKRDQIRYALPRSWLIYEGLKKLVPKADYFDFNSFFEKNFGFSLEAYFESLFILEACWHNQTLEHWDEKFNVVNPTTIFEKVLCPTDPYLKALSYFSNQVTETKALQKGADKKKVLQYLYEHFDIRTKPLIKMDAALICGNYQFLIDQFWSGPYNLVLTNSKSDEEKDLMFRYLGEATELYVRALSRDAFGANFSQMTLKDNIPFNDGVIKINAEWIVVIETKAGRPTRPMVSGDKPITELDIFEKLLSHGLTQLSERICAYRAETGFKGKISPILVSAGIIPQNDSLWELYVEKLGHLPIFKENGAPFPVVCDLESWEVITAVIKSGTTLDVILSNLEKEPWSKSGLSNFFYHFLFKETLKSEPAHSVMQQAFTYRTTALSKKLFNSGNAVTESEWLSVFNL